MVDYAFYIGKYRGSRIPTGIDFERYAARASEFIAFLKRDYTVKGEEVDHKKAACAIADAIYANETAAAAALSGLSGGAVASKSIGSVSVSYRGVTAADAGIDLTESATQRQYYSIARRYLTIYRGVR